MQINFPAGLPDNRTLTVLLNQLTLQKINLPFLCRGTAAGGTAISFCVAPSELSVAAGLVDEVIRSPEVRPEIIQSVGILTLYPHQSSLRVLGLVLSLFGQQGLPVHGLCTSISALAVLTDYRLLDRGAEVLQTVFRLPENHSPFHQQLPRRLAEQVKKSR